MTQERSGGGSGPTGQPVGGKGGAIPGSWLRNDWSRTLPRALALGALVVLGFLLRSTNAAEVFVGADVLLPENDPYYQVHRVFLTIVHYPWVPLFDPLLDHPHGAAPIWPPLFPWLLATLAWVTGLGPEERSAVEALCALFVPLVGAVTCVPVYLLSRRILARRPVAPDGRGTAAQAGSWPSLLAAALATLIPAHIWYSRLGFVDHHAAVTLAQVMMLLAALWALDEDHPSAAGAGRRRLMRGTLLSLSIATGLLLWNGYLLFIGIVDGYLLLRLTLAPLAERRRMARLIASSHAAGAALVLPWVVAIVGATKAPFTALTLSYFQIAALFGFAGVALVASSSAPRRWLPWLLVGVALGAIVALGTGALGEGVAWIFASDAFMASVQEGVPIFRTSDGQLDLWGPQIWLTRFFFFVPLMLAALLLRVLWFPERRPGLMLLLVWSAALFLLALRQRRFAEAFAPALAILVAWALSELHAWIRALLVARGAAERFAAAMPAAGLALTVAYALALYYAPIVRDPAGLLAVTRVGAGQVSPDEVTGTQRIHRALARLADLASAERRVACTRNESGRPLIVQTSHAAVRESSEHCLLPGEQAAPPTGVMSLWPLGHKIIYLTGLPVAASPFGTHIGGSSFDDAAGFFLEIDELAALRRLEPRRIRWVVVDNDLGTMGAAILARGGKTTDFYRKTTLPDGGQRIDYQPPLLHTLYMRLAFLAGGGASVAADGEEPIAIPSLEHFRLVADSADDHHGEHPKVYEVVPGARMVIDGEPGAVYDLQYAFSSNLGRDRVWQQRLRAGDDGIARGVAPYSSERPDLGQASPYVLRGPGGERRLHVPEADVLSGNEIRIAAPRGSGSQDLAQVVTSPAGG